MSRLVIALFWSLLCGCATFPDESFFDRLVMVVVRLRDSNDPAEKEHYAVMQMTAYERKIAKQFSDLHPDDPVAMITCVRDKTVSPDDEDSTEPSEPEIPQQLSNFPTRYTVNDLINCMANGGLDSASAKGFWLAMRCVTTEFRHAKLFTEYLVSTGLKDAACKVVMMPGFRSPSERTWAESSAVSPEEIVTMLLGLQKPLPGIPMKWFTTNMVEPFPGCGLCKSAPVGGDR